MTENPLGYEKISKLLKDFAIPSIMASLVGSIYNIVDQIFIGQGVGYLGNAATNVAYPFSTICLAIALLVGIGSASRVSLCLGRKEPKAAAKAAGNGIVLMGIFGIIYLLVGEAFLSLLLKAFGATTDVFPSARIKLLIPFVTIRNGIPINVMLAYCFAYGNTSVVAPNAFDTPCETQEKTRQTTKKTWYEPMAASSQAGTETCIFRTVQSKQCERQD